MKFHFLIISILIFTGCQNTKLETYSSDQYSFNYQNTYSILEDENVLTIEGGKGRVEIFNANDFDGERIHGYSSSGLEEFEYEFVPKEKLTKEPFTIWLFYMEGDEETKETIQKIYESFTVNNSYESYESCIEKFYISKDKTLENSNYYSNLIEVDATKIKVEEIIATYKDLDFEVNSEQEVVFNLLKSKYISTYWDLESELCLVEETSSQKIYKTIFDASLEYCTNECLTKEYSFSITIDKQNGVITISP